MQQTDFYKLFAETGEPLYWLLSRAENGTREKTENPERITTPPPQME